MSAKAAKPIPASSSKEESKGAVAADNPWGLDESQYYIELGGVSKFLQFRKTLKQAPQGNWQLADAAVSDPFSNCTKSDATLSDNIDRVLHLLDQVNLRSMQFQRAHALKNYSDLLLSENTNYRTAKAQELASFLAQINTN